MIAEIVVLVAATLATRIPFLLAPSSDKATQLWVIETFAVNRRIAPLHFPDSLRQGMLAYPPLPHLLFAFLPRRLRPVVGTATNLTADVVHALTVYVVLTTAIDGQGQITPVSPAMAFTLLFATLPILHPINARLAGIGARTIGPLLFTLYALSLYAALNGASLAFHGACVVIAVLIILSSQFALQATLATSLLLSLFLLSFLPVLLIAAAMGAGLLIPNLNIGPQLRCKLWHYRWYMTALHRPIDTRNSLARIRHIFAGRSADAWLRLAVYLVSSTTPTIVMLGIGTIAFAAAQMWPPIDRIEFSPLLVFCMSIVAASLLLCAATVQGPLKIFGEAERYVEYAAPFATLAVALPSSVGSVEVALLLLLVLVNVIVIVVQWSITILPMLRASVDFQPTDDMKGLVAFLDGRPGRRIVASPIFLASALAMLCKGNHAFLHVLVTDSDGRFSHWTEDLVGYPHLRGRADHFARRYKADTIVLDRDSLDAILRLDPDADIGLLPVAYRNTTFRVIELSGHQQ